MAIKEKTETPKSNFPRLRTQLSRLQTGALKVTHLLFKQQTKGGEPKGRCDQLHSVTWKNPSHQHKLSQNVMLIQNHSPGVRRPGSSPKLLVSSCVWCWVRPFPSLLKRGWDLVLEFPGHETGEDSSITFQQVPRGYEWSWPRDTLPCL